MTHLKRGLVVVVALAAALAAGCGPNPYDGSYSGLLTYTYFTRDSGGNFTEHSGNSLSLKFTVDCTNGGANTSSTQDAYLCKITKASSDYPQFGAQFEVETKPGSFALLPMNPPVTDYKGEWSVAFPNGSSIVSTRTINVSGLRSISGPPPDPSGSFPNTWLGDGPGNEGFPTEAQDTDGTLNKPTIGVSYAINKD